MTSPFDPDRLLPWASLNRVRIADLPGAAMEPAARGKLAYDLLSTPALAALAREHAAALKLAGDLSDDARLPLLFDECLASTDDGVRAAAEAIAAQVGRRLGLLLAVLKRGDSANRQARPDWDDGHWAHWAGIDHVRLGGGLVSGNLGRALGRHAGRFLAEAGAGACDVAVADHPRWLPLIGAARSAAPGCASAVVFDFGHGSVKRGIASYDDIALASLRVLPVVALHHEAQAFGPADASVRVAEVMADVMAGTWREAGAPGLSPAAVASIASYVIDGQPAEYDRGIYANLRAVVGNLGDWLSRGVSERAGRQVRIQLLHDGSAAARVFAGQPRAAVIMMGSALGIGFPPGGHGLRPLAPGFHLMEPPPRV